MSSVHQQKLPEAAPPTRIKEPPPGAESGPETPSGKGAGDENFPVGSWLLPPHLRPCVAAFYAFARAADDIADNPALAPDDKIGRLRAFEAALTGSPGYDKGYEKARTLRAHLDATGVRDVHARDLLAAFRQDATKSRYANWDELMGYCELSANPVGRFLLDLHGDGPGQYGPSDALCTVLQVLNHLQDCGGDYRILNRVYVPEDWMSKHGTCAEDLAEARLSPGMRRTIDRMLDGCDALMRDARRLPGVLKSRRLAAESAVIVNLARRLSARLREGDPLATRVALSRTDFLRAGVGGIFTGLFGARPGGAAS